MATFDFDQVLVWDLNPGGVVRTLRNGTVTVLNPATSAVIATVVSDSTGRVQFTTTDVATVLLRAPSGFTRRVTSQTAIEAAAGATVSNDAAVAALVSGATTTRTTLNGNFVGVGSQIKVPTEGSSPATPGGVVDATTAIQARIDATPVGGICDGLGQTFLVSTLNLKSDMTFRNFRLKTKPGSTAFVSPVTIGAYNDTTLRKNIQIRNVYVDGQRAGQTSISGAEDGGRHGFRIIGRVEDLLIENCEGLNCASDGIAFYHGLGMSAFLSKTTGIQKRITVRGSKFNGNRRHGGSGDSMDGVLFDKCEFNDNGLDIGPTEGEQGSRLSVNPYGNGFDLEEYAITTWTGNIEFNRCELLRNAKSGVLCFQPSANLADDPTWVPRSGYVFRKCKIDNGVGAGATTFSIDITPLSSNKALGWYYDDVAIIDCNLTGGPSLRSVKNARHEGGTVTSTTSNIGNADTVQSLTVTAPRNGKRYAVSAATVKYVVADDPETIFLKPSDLGNIGGTPTFTAGSAFSPSWTFSDAENDRLGAVFLVPSDWGTAHIDFLWYNGVATAGAVSWRTDTGSLAEGATASDAVSGNVVVATAGAQSVVVRSRVATSRTMVPGPMNIEILRLGSDAGDTLAGNAQLVGVQITRAS